MKLDDFLLTIVSGCLAVTWLGLSGCSLLEAQAVRSEIEAGLSSENTLEVESGSGMERETRVTPDSIRVEGIATAESDVSTLLSSRFRSGEVLFIPVYQERVFADIVRLDDVNQPQVNRISVGLEEEDLSALKGHVATINSRGQFAVELPAGPYLVCLADVFVDHAPGPPFTLVGCSSVELTRDSEVTVSFGEGGVYAEVRQLLPK